MNKFEQVSSDGHQMSLLGGRGEGVPMSHVGGGRFGGLELGGGGFHAPCPGEGGRPRGLCTLRSNASWVMVTWGPLCEQNDRQT